MSTIFELFKYSAKTAPKSCNIPETDNYLEVHLSKKVAAVKPEDILLVKSDEKDFITNIVRLQDTGYEVLSPNTLLDLLLMENMPEEWKGKTIEFPGAIFPKIKKEKYCNDPSTISVEWRNWTSCVLPKPAWDICYGDMADDRSWKYTAVIKRGD